MKALVFDFDGIIVDTESPELVSYEELYAPYGVEFPFDPWIRTVGGELTFNAYEYLQNAVGRNLDIDALRQQRRRRHWELTLEEPLCAGAEDYIRQAKDIGLQLAIASSSPREWVEPLLDKHNIGHLFETIITADLVEEVKPDPTLYLLALDALGVKGEEALAIEDSVNGLRAAKAAGMHCVIVPNPVTVHLNWPPDLEDYRLTSLTSMSLSELLAALDSGVNAGV